MIILSWSFDLGRRVSWILPNLNADNRAHTSQELIKYLCEYYGSVWDGLDLFIAVCMVLCLDLWLNQLLITPPWFGYWRTVLPQCEDFLCSHFAFTMYGRGWVGEQLERDTSRTIHLNSPKEYSIWYNVMLSNKTGLAEEEGGGVRAVFQGSYCLEIGWTSICLQQVVSLCNTSLHLHPVLSFIKLSALPNLSHYAWGLSKWLYGWLAVGCCLPTTVNIKQKRIAKNFWGMSRLVTCILCNIVFKVLPNRIDLFP